MTEFSSKFSGHETFPLRYGWLYKAVRSIRNDTSRTDRPITSGNAMDVEKSVVRMGVGKNMVNSIRYWSQQSHIVRIDDSGRDILTIIANHIFGEHDDEHGWDPYMENPATIWILHWLLNYKHTELSAARWFFNYFNGQRFDKQQLLDSLLVDIEKSQLKAAEKTVSKDIECMLQCYAQRASSDTRVSEDSFTSPLVELGLLRVSEQGKNKKYTAELGDHESLPNEVFAFALIDYWSNRQLDKTIAFDSLLTDHGSPARVFRLSQSALANRLDAIEELTHRDISWTDTQGLRQIQCEDIRALDKKKFEYLNEFYKQGS